MVKRHHCETLCDIKVWARLAELPAYVQDQAHRNFEILKRDVTPSSLHFKKVGSLRSARITLNDRALGVGRKRSCLLLDRRGQGLRAADQRMKLQFALAGSPPTSRVPASQTHGFSVSPSQGQQLCLSSVYDHTRQTQTVR
jgi:hypothetical protein